MPASTQEIEAVRFHLGYGNLGTGATPYTPDGFFELFHDVAKRYINEAEETTASTTIAAGIVEVTPAAMTGISTHARVVVDVSTDAETVVVRSTTVSTFTARFVNVHTGTYPVAVESGLTRLRGMLVALEREHNAIVGGSVSQASGLKQVGRGAVEWFAADSKFKTTWKTYRSLVGQLSSLIRIAPWGDPGATSRLEAY